MSHRQITEDERYIISRMHKDNYSIQEIGKAIGKHRSTVAREFARNTSPDGGYRPTHASAKARVNLSKSRKKSQFGKDVWQRVEQLIRLDWSPEQISLVFKEARILNISFKTIYRYIRRDEKSGGDLHTHLRQFSKFRRKKNGSADSRGVLRGKRNLDSRPPGAKNRSRKGHFEIDLMHGKPDKDCLLTLVDRKTIYTKVLKLKNKSKAEVAKALIPIIKALKIKTITADNGTEWHGFKEIEKICQIKFYFAEPYHSWERGTNENTNGLIRQYAPKGKSMKGITKKFCKFIEDRLNNRPRKKLNMESPDSLYFGYSFLSHFK